MLTAYKKPDNERLIAMLRKTGGNVSQVAAALHVSRTMVYNWIKADPELEDALEDVRESLLDNAETLLQQHILGEPALDEWGKQIGWKRLPDLTAVIFFLKTKGKTRGYVERMEQEFNNRDVEIIIKAKQPKPEDAEGDNRK